MGEAVGLVGVGAMGGALLSRLILAGHRVNAFDVAESGLQRARLEGAQTVASPALAARGARFVHVFVTSDQQVLDATLGADGVLAGMEDDAVLILQSTTSPETTRRVAQQAQVRGLRVADAPITSVPSRVRDGKSAFLIGADAATAELVAAHLEGLGGTAYRFGPLGAGNIAKIAKNFANAAFRTILFEALSIAQTGGLDGEAFMRMMEAEEHGSQIAQWRKLFDFSSTPAAIRPFPNLFDKDIQLAEQLAADLGLDAPAARGTAQSARRWVETWRLDKESGKDKA